MHCLSLKYMIRMPSPARADLHVKQQAAKHTSLAFAGLTVRRHEKTRTETNVFSETRLVPHPRSCILAPWHESTQYSFYHSSEVAMSCFLLPCLHCLLLQSLLAAVGIALAVPGTTLAVEGGAKFTCTACSSCIAAHHALNAHSFGT